MEERAVAWVQHMFHKQCQRWLVCLTDDEAEAQCVSHYTITGHKFNIAAYPDHVAAIDWPEESRRGCAEYFFIHSDHSEPTISDEGIVGHDDMECNSCYWALEEVAALLAPEVLPPQFKMASTRKPRALAELIQRRKELGDEHYNCNDHNIALKLAS